jgi:hypothetical protein
MNKIISRNFNSIHISSNTIETDLKPIDFKQIIIPFSKIARNRKIIQNLSKTANETKFLSPKYKEMLIKEISEF